jgi:ubiquinone/menaquinone biosynthesis C-methylase UbiE
MASLLANSFDVIHSMSFFECLEHADFEKVMAEIKRVLKPNGVAFVVASANDIEALTKIAGKLGLVDVKAKFEAKMKSNPALWAFADRHKWSMLVIEKR